MSLEGKRTSCLDLRFRANLISLLTLRVIFPPPDRRCDKVKHNAARFTPDRVINATRSLPLCFSRDSLQNKQTDRLANKQTNKQTLSSSLFSVHAQEFISLSATGNETEKVLPLLLLHISDHAGDGSLV